MPGAIGCLVHRDGVPVRQPDVDVAAVPACRYVDTGTRGGAYAVAAVATMEQIGPLSAEAHARPLGAQARPLEAQAGPIVSGGGVNLAVDTQRVTRTLPRPWRPMIGSEHLSHLLNTEHTGGRPIGA
ncbi:hypothetical protein [Nonomuraea lactucae]|uniref:hypothetical protein n=1 Tax=Nonomuraea lactucae TaxID=2249762 RepID=UPI00196562DE|nr:hypothetical protein [Nonomuraea lactucae]